MENTRILIWNYKLKMDHHALGKWLIQGTKKRYQLGIITLQLVKLR